jgi:protein gp37
MGVDTKIEWCHHTANSWWGCTKVSDGCKNCYAELWAKRHLGEFSKDHNRKFTDIMLHPEKYESKLA